MNTKHETDVLNEAIARLENKQADELKFLREQFQVTYESLKPINLIVNTLKEAAGSSKIKGNILNTSVGLTAGFLSKFLFVNVSRSPFRRLIGNAVLYGITNIVSRNPETIKSIGNGIVKLLKKRAAAKEQKERLKELA